MKQRHCSLSAPPPRTVSQCSDQHYPTLVNTEGSTPLRNRCTKTKKKDQMKEQIKAPEKIQLSYEEIANLPDAQFKTLVIRMLREMVEYGCKIQEEVKL